LLSGCAHTRTGPRLKRKNESGRPGAELEQLLKNLKLRRILEIYDEQLRAADKDDMSYSDFVTRLVRAQFQARQEGALEWRIQRAKLPERWTLETFPFARQPGVNRKQIRGFAELEFIAKAENIVFVGKTAVGKTGLASGLLMKALENGISVWPWSGSPSGWRRATSHSRTVRSSLAEASSLPSGLKGPRPTA
jgi:hypothetical protein